MSDDELNRRIAVEVMGEPEPTYLPGRRPGPNDTATTIFSERGNWWWDGFFGWKPIDFCGDFTQAMWEELSNSESSIWEEFKG